MVNRDQSGGTLSIKTPTAADPVHGLIEEIVAVVASSRWSFVRFKERHSGEVLNSDASEDAGDTFVAMREELRLQRAHTAKGPRLAPVISELEPAFSSGITLVFADMRRDFGMLCLFRTPELGPFTSLEVQALTLALDASIDRLAGLAVALPKVAWKSSLSADRPVMHVLDTQLNIVLTWDAGIHAVRAQRLPPLIEKTVHSLVRDWTDEPATHLAGVGQPVSFLTVRTQPLSGSSEMFVGVLLDRAPGTQIFDLAARSFSLSTRELETLAMLLQGAKLNEIAFALNITNSTVQDHIKSMLDKTASKNRSEMIGKLLNPARDHA